MAYRLPACRLGLVNTTTNPLPPRTRTRKHAPVHRKEHVCTQTARPRAPPSSPPNTPPTRHDMQRSFTRTAPVVHPVVDDGHARELGQGVQGLSGGGRGASGAAGMHVCGVSHGWQRRGALVVGGAAKGHWARQGQQQGRGSGVFVCVGRGGGSRAFNTSSGSTACNHTHDWQAHQQLAGAFQPQQRPLHHHPTTLEDQQQRAHPSPPAMPSNARGSPPCPPLRPQGPYWLPPTSASEMSRSNSRFMLSACARMTGTRMQVAVMRTSGFFQILRVSLTWQQREGEDGCKCRWRGRMGASVVRVHVHCRPTASSKTM